MTDAAKNLPASVAARLLNRAKQTGDDYQFVLTNFCFERFLYRWALAENIRLEAIRAEDEDAGVRATVPVRSGTRAPGSPWSKSAISFRVKVSGLVGIPRHSRSRVLCLGCNPSAHDRT